MQTSPSYQIRLQENIVVPLKASLIHCILEIMIVPPLYAFLLFSVGSFEICSIVTKHLLGFTSPANKLLKSLNEGNDF